MKSPLNMPLEIPPVLRRKVLRFFGQEGEAWLKRLPALFAACIDKWKLTGCMVSPVISINYLCFARSPDFGEVALKIGIPDTELFTEIEALTRYRGRQICNCFDHDPQLGAMLLERIIPGDDLTTVQDPIERTYIAARLAAVLPIALSSAETGAGYRLPRVSEWAARAFARIRRENIAGPRMLFLVDAAEELLGEIEAPDRPLVLLHGDLNHWNILRDGDGGWRAIDPKGAIGVRCLEAARYMINEIELLERYQWELALDRMVSVIGAEMGEPRHIVAACAFFDSALSTCWSFEEHERRDLTAHVDRCGFFLDEYRRIRSGV